MQYEFRRFDGYPRPRRIGLIIALLVVLFGVAWIDWYDVPNGLRRLDCDIHLTSLHGILTSPKFYWALPILLAEIAFWIRVMIWIWPSRALAEPVPSDWVLIAQLFLLGLGISLYAMAALQPAPWNGCP